MVVRQRAGALAVLIALLAAALGGCFLPVFDLETSLAYQTASKMDKVGTIGPLEISEERIAGASEYYYVPSRTLASNHGLLVVEDSSGASISYFAEDTTEPGNPVQQVDSTASFFFNNSSADSFRFVVVPFRDPTPAPDDSYIVAYNVGDNANLETWGYFSGGPDFSQVDTETVSNWTGVGIPPAINLGIAFDVNGFTGFWDALILVRDGPADEFDIYADSHNDSLFPGPPMASPGTPSPTPDGRVLNGGVAAFDSPNHTAIFSAHAGGGFYDVYKIDTLAPTTAERLPVRQSIDEILSTGELYHRGAGSDEVYDSSGKKKYSIPTGKLHFAYENTDGSEPVMFYTLVYFDRVEGDDDNMYIDIYAIPTADLRDLE